MKLEGKVAIVTGAASGFGRAIAELFAQQGARVVMADVNGDGAREVAAAFGKAALPLTCDVSRKADVDGMVRAAERAFGGVDILVNNAGTTHHNQPLLERQRGRVRSHLRGQREVDLPDDDRRRADAWRRAAAASSSTSPRPPAYVRARASPGTTAPRAR